MEFKAAERVFKFETHGEYAKHLSINVKVHLLTKLDQKDVVKLAKLVALDKSFQGEIQDWAWERTIEDFWEWARLEAEERGLGEVYAEGRSGGHLILNHYSVERVNDLCAAYESECELCHRGWEHHPNRACLFQSTTWKSLNEGCLAELETVKDYFRVIEDNLKGCPDNYHYHLKDLIDNRWKQRPTQRELKAAAKVIAWRTGGEI